METPQQIQQRFIEAYEAFWFEEPVTGRNGMLQARQTVETSEKSSELVSV